MLFMVFTIENNQNIRSCSSVTKCNKCTIAFISLVPRLSWGHYSMPGSCRSCGPQLAPFNLEKSQSPHSSRRAKLNWLEGKLHTYHCTAGLKSFLLTCSYSFLLRIFLPPPELCSSTTILRIETVLLSTAPSIEIVLFLYRPPCRYRPLPLLHSA